MRILLLTQSSLDEQAACNAASLHRYLESAGHQADVITVATSGADPATRTIRALHAASRLPTPDVVLAACDDATATLCACMWRLISEPGRRPRFVRYVHQVNERAPRSGFAARLPNAAALCSRAADAIIVPGNGLKRRVVRQLRSANDHKVHVCWPGHAATHKSDTRDSMRAALGLSGRFVVAHHGDGHCFDRVALAQAIELTRTDQSVAWVVRSNTAAAMHLSRGGEVSAHLSVLDGQRYSQQDLLQLADVNLVSATSEQCDAGSPADLLPLLAQGKPTIAICACHSDWQQLMESCNAGVVIPSGHGEMLARSVWQLRDSKVKQEVLGRGALRAYEAHFTPAAAHKRLERILTEEHEHR